jgi:hypothetical protein
MILSPKGFGLDLHLTPYCFRQPLIELISSQVITIYHAAYLKVLYFKPIIAFVYEVGRV